MYMYIYMYIHMNAGSEDNMSCTGLAQGEGLDLEFLFESTRSLP